MNAPEPTDSYAPQAEPVLPLEYGRPPPPPAGRARDLVLCIGISLAMSVGAGLVVMGLMSASGYREDPSAFTACGVAFLTLGGCLIGTIAWLRVTRR